MDFMRGSIAVMELDSFMAMGAMPVDGGAAVVLPGLAQAVASVATDNAAKVRMACMLNS
jgi:hypothetical protein